MMVSVNVLESAVCGQVMLQFLKVQGLRCGGVAERRNLVQAGGHRAQQRVKMLANLNEEPND